VNYVGKRRRGRHPDTIETVGDLITALQAYDEDAEIRLAIQPRWPMEHVIGPVIDTGEVVWLGDGGQIGALPENAITEFGWR
jgi:hypothetical protein